MTFRRLLAPVVAIVLASSAGAFDLSIDVTHPPAEHYEDAIAIIKEARATATSLSIFWDDLEPTEGRYAPEFDWPAIANLYYPTEALSLSLTFSVIDTVADRRPEWLQGLAWDDPRVLTAFSAHIDAVMSRMRDVDIVSVSIGNEIDGHLSSAEDIAAFARFLAMARARVARWTPDTPIGSKLTFEGLMTAPDRWQPVLAESTALGLTYYPITSRFAVRRNLDIEGDVSAMLRAARGKPVFILEAGYPSAGCDGTEEGQRAFVAGLLEAATLHTDLRLVSLTWLTDISADQVRDYQQYYGVGDTCFAAFLSSLGLRYEDGTAKPALEWLMHRN